IARAVSTPRGAARGDFVVLGAVAAGTIVASEQRLDRSLRAGHVDARPRLARSFGVVVPRLLAPLPAHARRREGEREDQPPAPLGRHGSLEERRAGRRAQLAAAPARSRAARIAYGRA